MQTYEINGIKIQEEGDLLVAIVDRLLTLEITKQFCHLAEQVREREKRLFVLSVIQGHQTASAEARRYFSEWTSKNQVDASAMVSSSTLARATMTLIISAAALISRRAIPTAFFATEAEARAWIDRKRQQISAPR